MLFSGTAYSNNDDYSDESSSISLFQFGGVDFFNDTIVHLSGKWDFYWDQFILPQDITYTGDIEKGEVPGFWKNYEGRGYPSSGMATYRTMVVLPNEYPILALHLGDIHNSYKLYVNGKLYHSVGEIGSSKSESVPKWLPELVVLQEQGTELDIVLQVSNYRHRNGGLEDVIRLGSFHALSMEKDAVHLADIFLGGALLVIGMFFLGMYFFWKEDKASLFFAFFSISLAIRVLIVGWRVLLEVSPWLPWEVAIRIEYGVMFMAVLFYLHFVYHAFPKQTNTIILKTVSYFYYVLIASVIFTPVNVFSYSIFPNNILVMILIFYALFVYIKAYRDKIYGAFWAILSYVFLIITVTMAITDYANVIVFNPLVISIGFISFVLSMSLIFASRFGRAFYEVEELKIQAEEQNELILEKNEEISEQHNLIKDSIHYAKRIQRALLPELNYIERNLTNTFVYYQPQNVVSGDFYWFKRLEGTDEAILVIADCTGHGVPGAFMSIVGMNSLDNIITSNPDLSAAEILVQLNNQIQQKLNASDKKEKLQDGMDIIICRINLITKKMHFASALHKLVLIRDGKPQLFNGSRHFIGNDLKKGFEFEENELSLNEGDQIFMFSDGVYDQKGGERGKKLYYSRFEEILIELTLLEVDKQKGFLEDKIDTWKGNQDQLDDMLVFGWKIT